MLNIPLIGENSFINYQEFLSSGTFTRPLGHKWTKAWIMVVGGGGGGNYSASGGPGACMMREVYLSGNSYTVTIGAGGASGSNGGTTSFGSILTATGGIQSAAGGAMGAITDLVPTSARVHSFEYASYGYVASARYFSNWTYKKISSVGSTGANGFNGNSGENSGAGGTTSSPGYAGYSGYCIIFYEDEAQNCPKNRNIQKHLKIQEFSSSGTWYRPTRFPATLVYVCLKVVDNSSRNFFYGGTFFLTEPSYTMTIGTVASFGSIMSSSAIGINANSATKMYTASGVQNSTGKIVCPAHESLGQTNAWVMWYE